MTEKYEESLKSLHHVLADGLTQAGNAVGLKGRMYCEFGIDQIVTEVSNMVSDNALLEALAREMADYLATVPPTPEIEGFLLRAEELNLRC